MKTVLRLSALTLLAILTLSGLARPDDTKPMLTLRENLVIGGDGGDANGVGFSEIRGIQVDDQGQIYVLDSKECLVKVFDPKGKLIRSFGKRGQGPGEFQYPLGMWLSKAGLSIFDFSTHKIIRFDPQCSHLEDLSLKEAPFGFGPVVESGGCLFGRLIDFDKNEAFWRRLVRFDPSDRSMLALAESKMAGGIKKKALLEDTYRIKRLSDGRLVWIDTGEFCLHITSSDGKALFRRTKEYQPVKVSEAYKEKLIVSQYGSKDKIPPGTTFIWPKHLSPIKYLETADNGWIIIQTTTEDARGWSRYDVFSGNVCEYIGSFYHPDEEYVYEVKSGLAYFRAEDQDGYPVVKRYEIRLSK